MKIQHKLFLALVGTGICLVLIMLALMRWSIDRGMLEYINTREAELLQPFVQQLGELYGDSGSWELLRNNHRQIQQLLRQSAAQRNQAPPRPGMRPPPPVPRLSVIDLDKRPLFGRYRSDRPNRLHPITYQGETVGWVVSPERREIVEGFELTFIKQQSRALLAISSLVLLLALLIGWPLSRHFLKPINQLARHIAELNRGNYRAASLIRNDELGELARDINELAHTLAGNEDIRKRWLADTSHELRTPIAILRGELEAMLDGVRPMSEENIQSLHQEVQQLQKLVEDLHELSNAEIGGMRYRKETIDLVELVEEQVERHGPRYADSGLQLLLRSSLEQLPAWVDESRINQLLDNLLSNSLKYTAIEGKTEIALRQVNGNAVITISDSAPGVPDSALGRLFEHLYRVDSSRNRRMGGSGLGLAICQKIVEGHHGTIDASHSPLGGLCITVSLPLNPTGVNHD